MRKEILWSGLESLEAFLHELLLGEADPPLAGLAVFRIEDFLANSISGFLTKLLQVLTHQIWKKIV